ncbi:MAG: hypothetical protein R3E82_22375 [Pseudomonadales bacterium]|nr:hypothetical protein [Pseudomonadales bacterium]
MAVCDGVGKAEVIIEDPIYDQRIPSGLKMLTDIHNFKGALDAPAD